MSVWDPFEEQEEPDPFEANALLPKATFSASSISTFMRCPEQYRREYVKGETRASGPWGLSGSAFHDARHAALELQATLGREVPLGEIPHLYNVAWTKRLAEDAVEWGSTKQGDIYQAGLDMALAYHKTLGKTVTPIRMEAWESWYVDGVPARVVLRVDVETEDEVIDTKTGKQLFHKLQPGHYVQGCIYAAGIGKTVRFHSVSQKPAATTNDDLRVVPRPKVVAAAEAFVRDAYDGITYLIRTRGLDAEWPGTGPAGGACRWCSFRGRCPYVPD